MQDISSLYHKKLPICVITAWDSITGALADNSEADIALVGDSLAMVAMGYDDTNQLLLQEMIFHAAAVRRANSSLLLIADMPFGTYETSPGKALESAIQIVKESRVQGVKIEGGLEMVPTIEKLVGAGIPVMGHVGLTPQRHNALGGYKLQGNTFDQAKRIMDDCHALEKAGVFSVVLECVPNKLAHLITQQLGVPTIGIGAGPGTAGQVLVMADLLGMNDRTPAKFVKQYMDFFGAASAALAQYKSEVKTGTFPDADTHGYKMKLLVLAQIRDYLGNS